MKEIIKSGQIIVTRNGNRYLAIYVEINNKNEFIFLSKDGFLYFSNYNENLENLCSRYDIMEIYESPLFNNGFDIINNLESAKLVWSREKQQYFSIKEVKDIIANFKNINPNNIIIQF